MLFDGLLRGILSSAPFEFLPCSGQNCLVSVDYMRLVCAEEPGCRQQEDDCC